jgi:type II secretory pathway component PulF
MAAEVYMNIPEVQRLATNFNQFHQILDTVAKTLEALSTALKVTAWLSFGATAAAAFFIDRIKPNVKNLSKKMEELHGDINGAILAYRDGDKSGSDRFC